MNTLTFALIIGGIIALGLVALLIVTAHASFMAVELEEAKRLNEEYREDLRRVKFNIKA